MRQVTKAILAQLPSVSLRAVVLAGLDPLTGRERRIRETAPTHAEATKLLTKLQRQGRRGG